MQFQEEISEFLTRGVFIEHPSRRCAILLNVDGDQVEVGVDRLPELLSWHLSVVNFQWWITSDVGIVCQVENRSFGHEVQTFYLDGLNLQQSSLVESILVESVRRDAGVNTLGLIVDRTGASVGSDWEEILLGKGGEIRDYPDLLVLPERRFTDLGLAAAGRKVKRLAGELVTLGE